MEDVTSSNRVMEMPLLDEPIVNNPGVASSRVMAKGSISKPSRELASR
jgi:hypothetical protein